MTDDPDLHLTALERRLRRMSLTTASEDLRRRVLFAIDGTLREKEKAPTNESGWFGESSFPFFPDVAAGACAVSALVAAIAVVVFSASATSTSPVPLSLDDRARIAGVDDEALAADGRTITPVVRSSPSYEAPEHPGTLRVLDGYRLLQETL